MSLIRTLNDIATTHGFRSTFRDWEHDNGVARETAEACLALKVESVEGTYTCLEMLVARRPAMVA